jgi:hypothetical protein
MPENVSQTPVSSVGEIESDDAVIDLLPRTATGTKTTVRIHRLTLDRLAPHKAASFHASLETDQPSGNLKAEGTIGPWNAKDPGASRISGGYRYTASDLSSEGKFNGDLSAVETTGSVDVPQYPLTARFRASVDVQTAGAVLEDFEAHAGQTTILGSGSLQGQTARLRMTVNKGRVEDLLTDFSGKKCFSLTGDLNLQALVEFPPEPGFLKKMRLTSDFTIAEAKFTNPRTQTPVDRLGHSAEGEKHPDEDSRTVLSHLNGHMAVAGGTASLQNVSFEFPGASAQMSGTCKILPGDLDIHGTLRTTGTLSDATSGFKALLAKIATPFLKKNNTTVVPFTISGTGANPSVGLDLRNKTKL